MLRLQSLKNLRKLTKRNFGEEMKVGIQNFESKVHHCPKLMHKTARHTNYRKGIFKSIFNNERIFENKYFRKAIAQFGAAKHSTQRVVHSYPKIHDNSELLYLSSHHLNKFKLFRFSELLCIPYVLLFDNVFSTVFAFSVVYTIFLNSSLYEPCRRMPVRMDHLPHTE